MSTFDQLAAALAADPQGPPGTDRLIRWLSLQGLSIALWLTGALLAARFVQWAVARVTDHIDEQFVESDSLVRSENVKHRHSVAQVIAWTAYAVIYLVAAFSILRNVGLPVTSFVAPATVLGAALGFGAQRIVQDLLSGFFIITEKQYGYGDVVSLAITGSTVPADGTVDDVTLRVTKLRSSDGEMITIPNGQIIKAINLSKDWARSVVDIPVPIGADMTTVNDILDRVGTHASEDPHLGKLLLDKPTSMGVTQLEVDTVTVRMVAQTLPGKQFEVSRDLRSRIVEEFAQAGISLAPDSLAVASHSAAPDGDD
ncbi:mechanosensitive ion channel protein MscS [Williamsia sp. 1138]|uniref:mechanosensitive ion channel family protein n=1 Tax=Williamsia sp. 1138 TaxID=1903117 RepID=UPI000A120067|nr:mechanosensitive ion channel family protein [Williamsia sp. 1138]OZG26169.1 mechanosensitive ion channel protein MscS [Williamsia sp. 1138]